MDINIKTWLLDIQQSIEEIFEFLGDHRDFFAYQQDLKTKKAVERNLEIIGEAVSRILKIDNTFPLDEARNIINST
jgi:uncharacterized protein with HEPN domain